MYGHIRVISEAVQDDVSNEAQPFAVGLTLEKLSAHTVDKDGKTAFVTTNPMELLRKVPHGCYPSIVIA